MAAIPVWNILITGFTQNLANPTGFERLWSALRSQSGVGRCITLPLAWNFNAKAFAAFLNRNAAKPDECHLRVVAYSWGAGWGFTQLAKSLAPLGYDIAEAVLIDPVYRSPLHIFKWRSLINKIPGITPKIVIPANVRGVYSYFQKNDKPQGHKLVAADRTRTKIHSPRDMSTSPSGIAHGHCHMDDIQAIHEFVLELAGATPI